MIKTGITLVLSIAWIIGAAQSFVWTAQTSGVTTTLNDVHFVNNQSGWVVGQGGVILGTTDGGSTWTAQTSGTSSDLRKVFFIDADTGWVIGKDIFNILLKTTDGGANWSDITTSSIASGTCQDIAFANANTGWLVKFDSIYISNDGGTTWASEVITSDVSNYLHTAITATSDSTAYVASKSKRSASSAYADVFCRLPESVTSTKRWDTSNPQSSFSTSETTLQCISFATSSIGFAGGTTGKIYKMNFDGPNSYYTGPWQTNLDLMPASSFQSIKSISFPTAADGMFLTAVSAVSNALIYHTSDTGATWNMIPDTILGFNAQSMHAPEANYAWVVGLNGGIYKGVNSSTSIDEPAFSINTQLFPNPTNGLVTVKINGPANREISYKVVDIIGRQMLGGTWNYQGTNQGFELDMTGLTNGIYTLVLSAVAPNGENKVIRLVKQ